MKIAYLARIDLGKPSGVLKKIIRQISCWETFGHQVQLFALSRPFENYYAGLDKLSPSYWETIGYQSLFLNALFAARAIADWDPDLIFWRYSSYYPLYRKRLLKNFPTVIDVNSNYDHEYQVAHNSAAYYYHLATKDKLFKNVDGISTLTHEIADSFDKYNKPMVVIGDGIDLQEIAPLPPAENPEPILVCFASKNFPWIALDKIAQLAELRPEWKINILGLSREDIPEIDPPQNLLLHGFLDKVEYVSLLKESDVALGTLGLHRIGLSEMAPLKLREYLAYGLPTIIGYKDTDIVGDPAFILELPNQENNIIAGIKEIDTFVDSWRGKRVPRSQIMNLDIELKEQRRAAFFEDIIMRSELNDGVENPRSTKKS